METASASKPRDCIICGKAAGTAEHVFPSALGGRRTNTKIYCPDHNNWLAVHVAVLQSQLLAVNALLKVHPDRGNPRPVQAKDSSGQVYDLLGHNVQPVEQDVDLLLDLVSEGKTDSIRVTPKDYARLKSRAAERGINLEIEGAQKVATVARPVELRLCLGGEDGFRAVAYLALTFAAHHWPLCARAPGLEKLKDMLRSGANYRGRDAKDDAPVPSDFVSWCGPETAISSEKNSELVHTVAICINSGQLIAHVALFGTFRFLVLLGACEGADQTVITFVDPMQRHYGTDWDVRTDDHALIAGLRDVDHLRETIVRGGDGQRSLQELFDKIARVQTAALHEEAVEHLERKVSAQRVEPGDAIVEWMRRYRDLILRIVGDIAGAPPKDPVSALLVLSAQRFLDRQDATAPLPDGSEREAHDLEPIIHAFSEHMRVSHANGGFTFDGFEDLFLGKKGREIVAMHLVDSLLPS